MQGQVCLPVQLYETPYQTLSLDVKGLRLREGSRPHQGQARCCRTRLRTQDQHPHKPFLAHSLANGHQVGKQNCVARGHPCFCPLSFTAHPRLCYLSYLSWLDLWEHAGGKDRARCSSTGWKQLNSFSSGTSFLLSFSLPPKIYVKQNGIHAKSLLLLKPIFKFFFLEPYSNALDILKLRWEWIQGSVSEAEQLETSPRRRCRFTCILPLSFSFAFFCGHWCLKSPRRSPSFSYRNTWEANFFYVSHKSKGCPEPKPCL